MTQPAGMAVENSSLVPRNKSRLLVNKINVKNEIKLSIK